MNQPPTLVLRAALGVKNLVTLPRHAGEWPSFTSFLPDVDAAKKVPANAVCLYDTTGHKHGRLMRTGEVLQHWGVQVKVRSSDYQVGWMKANKIAAEMDTTKRLAIDAGNYLYLLHAISRGPVLAMGRDPNDQKRNHHFSINCIFPLEESEDQNFGENDTIYDSQQGLYELVHIDFPAWFEGA